MIKYISYILAVIVLFFACASPVRAQTGEADSSASLRKYSVSNEPDYRIINLRKFLSKYDSPLAPHAETLVFYADRYGLDYRLVASISGVESTFGKRIPYKSYNAYGWANGKYAFESWEDSIYQVSMTLRTKYIDSGAGSINRIARRYAPPSSTWAAKVKYFSKKIDTLPVTYDL